MSETRQNMGVAPLRGPLCPASPGAPDGSPPSGAAANAWQPIDSAPKDGSYVLTWGCLHDGGETRWETPHWRVSRFGECGWYDPGVGSHAPTHWMRLPEPPAKAEARHD